MFLGQARLTGSCALVACPEGTNQQCRVMNACYWVRRLLSSFLCGQAHGTGGRVPSPSSPGDGGWVVLCRRLCEGCKCETKLPKSNRNPWRMFLLLRSVCWAGTLQTLTVPLTSTPDSAVCFQSQVDISMYTQGSGHQPVYGISKSHST